MWRESYSTGIEFISWVVTEVNGRKFTILSNENTQRVITSPEDPDMKHMMDGVRVWVRAVIRDTRSGAKEIATYPIAENETPENMQKTSSKIIARVASYIEP